MRRLENSNLPAASLFLILISNFSPRFLLFFMTFFAASSQLIVHSSKVRTPQRHNSESVLYMNDEGKMNNGSANSSEDLSSNDQFQHRSSRSDNRLFPINTYTEQTVPSSLSASTTSLDAK
jgi:hypothetical protein